MQLAGNWILRVKYIKRNLIETVAWLWQQTANVKKLKFLSVAVSRLHSKVRISQKLWKRYFLLFFTGLDNWEGEQNQGYYPPISKVVKVVIKLSTASVHRESRLWETCSLILYWLKFRALLYLSQKSFDCEYERYCYWSCHWLNKFKTHTKKKKLITTEHPLKKKR